MAHGLIYYENMHVVFVWVRSRSKELYCNLENREMLVVLVVGDVEVRGVPSIWPTRAKSGQNCYQSRVRNYRHKMYQLKQNAAKKSSLKFLDLIHISPSHHITYGQRVAAPRAKEWLPSIEQSFCQVRTYYSPTVHDSTRTGWTPHVLFARRIQKTFHTYYFHAQLWKSPGIYENIRSSSTVQLGFPASFSDPLWIRPTDASPYLTQQTLMPASRVRVVAGVISGSICNVLF